MNIATYAKKFIKWCVTDPIHNYKSRRLRNGLYFCGQHVRLSKKIRITSRATTIIGNNVSIGENAYFKTNGWLRIGNNVVISRNVTIYTASHNYAGSLVPYDHEYIYRSVCIGDNVWIGMNVSIVPGVSIGEGAVIALGAVVTKDVPACAVAGGNPAKILKHRNPVKYKELVESRCIADYAGRPIKKEILESYLEVPSIPIAPKSSPS